MSRDIPSIPSSVADDLRWPLVRMREELQALLGFGPADRAALTQASGGTGSTTVIVQEVTGGGGGTTPDLTPPPTPSTFAAAAGFSQFIASWTGIGYTQGHGHKQANLYGVQRDPTSADPLPTFLDAQRINVAPNALLMISTASELNRRWHLWLTFETNDGVEGSPAGGTNGVVVTTGQDINQLLTVLNGQIGLSQLYRTLVSPLRDSMRRSDDAGVAQLSALVASHGEMQGRALALLNEAEDRGTAITDVRRVVDEGDAQLAQRITLLTAQVTSGDATLQAAVVNEELARVAEDGVLAGRASALEATVNNPTTGVAATALALDAVEAIVTHGASGNAALASRTSALEVSVNSPTDLNNPTYAALSITSLAFANYAGYASTLYAVRTQVSAGGRTVIGGFGLAGTSGGTAGPTIDFGVVANRFYVTAPATEAGIADVQPFVIQTTDETVNGVLIGKGVYMDAAYIKNLSALVARLGLAWIDSAMIGSLNADKLTAGDGTIGGRLKSTVYTPGSAGWIIRPDGTAEFTTIVARGVIYAEAGSLGTLAVDGALTMGTAGHLKGGQTAYATGTGFFLGYSGGAYKLSIGAPGSMLTWDGATLTVPAATITGQLTTPQIAPGAVSAAGVNQAAADTGPVSWPNSTALFDPFAYPGSPIISVDFVAPTTGAVVHAISQCVVDVGGLSASVAQVVGDFSMALYDMSTGGSGTFVDNSGVMFVRRQAVAPGRSCYLDCAGMSILNDDLIAGRTYRLVLTLDGVEAYDGVNAARIAPGAGAYVRCGFGVGSGRLKYLVSKV